MLHGAARALSAGDAAGALSAAERALKASPGHPEALHLRALAFAAVGRFDAAIADFEAAARIHPQRHAILSNLGNALADSGRTADAIDAYRRAVAFNPSFADGWYNLGGALKAAGDVDGAVEALERAFALQPRNAKAGNNLAVALEAAGRIDDAIAILERSTAAEPGFALALVNLGRLKRDAGKAESALADLEIATRLAPNFAEAHFQRANVERLLGRRSQAEASYRRAIALFPGSIAAHRELANMLWETGKRDVFLAELDRVIALAPTPELEDLRAELGFFAGDRPGTERLAARMIEMRPDRPEGFRRLANLRRAERRPEDALRLAAAAVERAPGDFAILHELAECMLACGRCIEAAALLGGAAPRAHLQKHVALRSAALRGAGDPAYRAYCDYDRFVAKIFIEPQGYASLAAFNDALAVALMRLHQGVSAQPINQTLYGGTQSVGNLWAEPDPAIQELKRALTAAAATYVGALPDEADHPFLRWKTNDLVSAGAWSVLLSSGGGHVDHFHPRGWISATYYVRVPPEVSGASKAGCLRLGAVAIDGFELPAERWVVPEEGAVVLFPSYMWHGVEPFVSTAPRLTAPFDLAPRLTLG
jgi:uncharacterized protein (TIGR02466 family)